MTLQFRMVAERAHRLHSEHHQGPVREPLHEVQQQAKQGILPGYDPVYSALLVKPTFLDPTGVSTTTWSTLTRKQTRSTLGPTTNKPQLSYSHGQREGATIPIVDASYIDHTSHDQGLGQADADAARESELQRLLQGYTTSLAQGLTPTEPLLGRNEERRLQREAGERGDEADNNYHQLQKYQFVVQCNHNNSSGFETWRRLHTLPTIKENEHNN
eukprot:402951-Amphidinium_carterae.5